MPSDNEMINNLTSSKCKLYSFPDMSKSIPKGSFSILSSNIRSLNRNFPELQTLLSSSPEVAFSAITLQEVWSTTHPHPLPGYHPLISNTRDKSLHNPNCGGGVGIYAHKSFKVEVLKSLNIFVKGVFESLWVKLTSIHNPKQKPSIIGTIYRPPLGNKKLALNHLESILLTIKNSPTLKSSNLIITSDFNINLADTHLLEIQNYLNLNHSFGLIPQITLPTHFSNKGSSILDHIFVSTPPSSSLSGVIDSPITDHCPTFYVDSSVIIKDPLLPFKKRIINKETIPPYTKLLKETVFPFFEEDPEKSFNSFFSLLEEAGNMAFPEVLITPKKATVKNASWMTKGLIISSKTKHKLFTLRRKSPSEVNILKYKTFTSILNKTKRKAKRIYYLLEFSNSKSDLKKTWSIINDLSGRKPSNNSKLSSTFIIDGLPNSNPDTISKSFNEFFATIGPNLANAIPSSHLDPSSHLNFLPITDPDMNFTFYPLNHSRFHKLASTLKSKWSFGPDLISNNLLKIILPIITNPFLKLVNLSLATGFVPKQVTIAKVLPIHKDGSKEDMNNYRPIALISSLGKLLEMCINEQLSDYLLHHEILSPCQFGFRKKHSVEHPLLLFCNNVLEAINKNHYILNVFVDLRKAFDSVNHSKLLDKLFKYGIQGIPQKWFQNYLLRFQYVDTGTSTSDILQMLFGIPQGTILGPILFLIFINDLPQATLLLTLLFADDTTFQVSGPDLGELITLLNLELAKAQSWFESNSLTLNAKKTKLMIYSPKPLSQITLPPVKIGQTTLEWIGRGQKIESIRFLGIWLDPDFSFTSHTTILQSKLSSAIFAIGSCQGNSPIRIRRQVYSSLFESLIRFGACIFGSAKLSTLNELYLLQKKALRRITGSHYNAHTTPLFKNLSILKIFDLIDLERSLIAHKLKHNKLPSKFQNFLLPISPDKVSIRHDVHSFMVPQSKASFLSRSPSIQIAITWNALPFLLKSVADHESFKVEFKKWKLASYNEDCLLPFCHSCHN